MRIQYSTEIYIVSALFVCEMWTDTESAALPIYLRYPHGTREGDRCEMDSRGEGVYGRLLHRTR
jgi:hypothetical protein